MKNILKLSLLALAVSGCRPMFLLAVDPVGPPEYQLGWEDGCDSGISAQGGWQYKVMYGFKRRPELAGNDQYKTGWNEGFTYCRFSMDTHMRPSTWESVGMGEGF